jgi:hypothetical protein
VVVARFKVHFQASKPVPSWTAWRQWRRGQLVVHTDHAEFESCDGARVLISNVTRVSQPSRRELYRQHDISWPVNTWIAVEYEAVDGPRVAYFNAARTLAHYLPHRRMHQRLAGLVAGASGGS